MSKKFLKIVAPVMAALVILAVVMSLLFVIHEAHHHCTGEDCPICARIEACINTVKNLINVTLLSILLFLIPSLLSSSSAPSRIFGKAITPVNLKVKLLN